MSIELKQIVTVAQKEFWERIRNRWVLAVSIIFAAFALIIAYFGTAQQGAVGFSSIDMTIASLVSLAIYLIPLIALILGYDAIVGEREHGSLDLLLSLPITRLELLLGKFVGLSAALSFPVIAGFGVAGIFLSYSISIPQLLDYFAFLLSSIVMGLTFLSMSILVSTISRSKVIASGAAIALWFVYVLVYDLLLMGLLVAAGSRIGSNVFPLLLLLNPADIYRVANILSMENVKVLYGLATAFPATLASPWVLYGMMLFWIIAPLGIAYLRFKKQ